MKAALWTLSMLVAASAFGCGGGTAMTPSTGGGGSGMTSSTGGGGSCGQVQPCGGAVVGTWKVANVCILDSAMLGLDASSICATATIELTKFTGTGGVTYGADQTYQDTGTVTIDFKLTVPTTCFATGKSCADVQDGYVQEMKTDSTLKSASCATSGAACVCQISTVQDATEAGTYATSGTMLSTTPTGGTASSDSYCVQGNELHDLSVDMSMPMGNMGTVKITGDIVFTKQ
jgi:hypothetical protein